MWGKERFPVGAREASPFRISDTVDQLKQWTAGAQAKSKPRLV